MDKKTISSLLKLSPTKGKNSPAEQDLASPENFKLIKSPHPLFPIWTQMLDLTQSEDNLLKNMKQKTRYNIKLAQKRELW